MDRAVSGQRRRLLHVVPSWRKATPGRAALATLVVALAILGATRAFALPTLRLVTNNNDSGLGSLRQAIQDAVFSNTDDTIEFSGVTGTITLTSGVLEIANSLHIVGPGASTLAISGGGTSQVFLVDSTATVSISGLTIGDAGGFAGFCGGIKNNSR